MPAPPFHAAQSAAGTPDRFLIDLVVWASRKDGQPGAFEQLMPVLYSDLKRIALGYLRYERPDHTPQATGLVHELYLTIRALRWSMLDFDRALHSLEEMALSGARFSVPLWASAHGFSPRPDAQPKIAS
jgi:hypothetical protein